MATQERWDTLTKERSGFPEFYRKGWRTARDAAWEILGSVDDAEDVAQQVLLRALRSGAWRRVERARAYTNRAARSEARSILRSRKRRQRRHADTPLSRVMGRLPPPADEQLSAKESQRYWEKTIKRLPARCQLVCSLVFVEGYTHSQVAKRLGISVKAVQKQIARGRRHLKKHRGSPGGEVSNFEDGGY